MREREREREAMFLISVGEFSAETSYLRVRGEGCWSGF